LEILIEIHHEDGFLAVEIRFRISRVIAKSKIRISKSNRDLLKPKKQKLEYDEGYAWSSC